MRILLVDPPGKNKGLNTGLAYLSAVLRNRHEVKVLDLNNVTPGNCGDPNPVMSAEQVATRIDAALQEFEPDLFGVSVKTFTADTATHILKLVISRNPEITTVVGGPHVTLYGIDYVNKNRINYGIQGEGEFTLPELCEVLENKESVENIEGLLFWRNGQLVHNPRTNTIKNLDALPLPDYGTFTSVIKNAGRLIEYPILTSRGCPYQCIYCSMPKIMGGKWRSHSPARVIEELKYAKTTYGSMRFTIVDDNFTLSLKRVETICDSILAEGINLPWSSQNGIRADRIDLPLAKKMKRSGCKYVWIGVESADEDVFAKLNKGESLENIRRGIKHLKNAGIRVGGFFIVGLPHSTRESDLNSVAFVKDLGIDGWWFNFVPYPQTEAWNWVQTNAIVLKSTEGIVQYGSSDIEPVFETKEYPEESRIHTYNEIHIKMKYFDRLVDPSLSQWQMWMKVLKKLTPFGTLTYLHFLIFLLKYNARLIKDKFSA